MKKLLVTGFEGRLGTELCAAAGVDPSMVRRIVLDLEVGSAGTIYVELFADADVLDVGLAASGVEITAAETSAE